MCLYYLTKNSCDGDLERAVQWLSTRHPEELETQTVRALRDLLECMLTCILCAGTPASRVGIQPRFVQKGQLINHMRSVKGLIVGYQLYAQHLNGHAQAVKTSGGDLQQAANWLSEHGGAQMARAHDHRAYMLMFFGIVKWTHVALRI